MSVHSNTGASSMYRWSVCPGSVALSKGIESKPSADAERGTRAHARAAEILENAQSFTAIPEEDLEAVQLYVNTVRADAGPNKIQVEVKFDLSDIYEGLFGTADAVVYDPISKILRVYDYKNGAGIYVEVENNSQLMYYGLGALLSTGHPCKEVELVIVQPRCASENGPIRRWRFNSSQLVQFASELEGYAAATANPQASFVSGDHCRFCPAAGICPKLNEQAVSVFREIKETVPFSKYNPEELAETLKKVSLLEDYAKAVRAFAYNEAEAGRAIPGFKLVAKRAVRKWKDGEEIAGKELLKEFGWARIHDDTLKSPAQVEKACKTEKEKELFRSLVVSVSSGLTLVENSDPRESAVAINPTDAFRVIEESKPINQLTDLF